MVAKQTLERIAERMAPLRFATSRPHQRLPRVNQHPPDRPAQGTPGRDPSGMGLSGFRYLTAASAKVAFQIQPLILRLSN